MSKISLEGNSLGSGTFTIAAPNSNTSYTLTLPENTGTVVTTGGASSLTTSGNLTFTGTGNRITGDMSNATQTNRLAFQTSTANSATGVNLLPNGTSSTSTLICYGNSDPTNAPRIRIASEGGNGFNAIYSDISGTGTYLPMLFVTGGSERMRIDTSGNVGIGTSSPSVSLQVNGVIRAATANDKGVIGIGESASGNQAANCGLWRGGANSAVSTTTGLVTTGGNFLNLGGYDGMVFTTGAANIGSQTERMRIDSSGNLLVGSTAAAGRIYGAHADNDRAVLRADATNASFTQNVQALVANRAANSAYTMLLTYSSAGGDVEHNLRGDGNAYADGTWNNNGADYAEFFEAANGQALTLGATVVLDGNKVREATEQDPASAVIGVVRPKDPSKASMVVGNTAWNKWANKYLTDDFDRYIMEDHDVVEWTDEDGKQHSYESHAIPEGITVPQDATVKTHDDKGNKFQHYKLNPAWNPDSEYVNRENRPEWNIIGLLGQVKILKGQPVGDRWVKMRDVSATVEEWFIR
jgi:hypothetical protein